MKQNANRAMLKNSPKGQEGGFVMQNQNTTPNKQEGFQETQQQEDKKVKKRNKNERISWWKSFLILFLTLGFSVSTAYYISDTFLWTKFDMDRVNEQLTYYKNKVEEQPNDPQQRVNLGYTYFLKGKNDEAIKQYKVALDLDENYYDAYLNLGIIYNDEDRFDEALKMFQKVTDIAPRDYKGHLYKGISYRQLKMYEDAIEVLSQANVLMPGNSQIIYEIGRVAESQGQNKEAEELYKEALNYDPLFKNALEGLDRIAKN
jgi:tetratricopeptide (TPR) repeat protein